MSRSKDGEPSATPSAEEIHQQVQHAIDEASKRLVEYHRKWIALTPGEIRRGIGSQERPDACPSGWPFVTDRVKGGAMSVERITRIDAEIVTIGQFDRSEKWRGKVALTLLDDGRVQIGNPTQSGFESITFALDDLREAVSDV